jgi:pimeloyl-ACP methyl ester carboxylesterase
MAEHIVAANDVQLCVDTFGDPTDPAILLIHGAGNSMLSWREAFCEQLAAAERFVIRYDSRDTGRSTTYKPGEPEYVLRDLVADAVGVLNALGLDQAHVVGLSQGAAIAQLVGLDHHERVATLTLMAGSPGGPGHEASDLPPMTPELKAFFSDEGPEPDWTDRDAVIAYLVEGERPFAGRSRPFDEAGLREVTARMIDRAQNLEATTTNPFMIDPGDPWRGRSPCPAAATAPTPTPGRAG